MFVLTERCCHLHVLEEKRDKKHFEENTHTASSTFLRNVGKFLPKYTKIKLSSSARCLFVGLCFLRIYFNLKMEAIHSAETSVICRGTRHQLPEYIVTCTLVYDRC
jgi:hypothetical protein